MRVVVRVYGSLGEKLKWKRRTVELPKEKASLAEVINAIPFLNEIINEETLDNYMVLINGINVIMLRRLLSEVNDGDEIDIFPPAAGGLRLR